jgi:hypothetical protein
MVTLKDNFCLSTEGRQQSVLDRYYALKRFPENEDLCFWVDKWIRIERDLNSAGLRELDSISMKLTRKLTHSMLQVGPEIGKTQLSRT